jgi:RND family efflux transporter MFP subunit
MLHLGLWAAAAAVLAALLAAGCGRGGGEAQAQENGAADQEAAIPVDVVVAALGDLVEVIEVTGTVEAVREISVGTAASDRVVYVAGDEGDAVTAGQVVVRMDTSDLDANIAQARAGVETARIRLEQAEEGHELVGINTDTNIETARSGLETARDRLSQAETAYDLTSRQVEDGIAQAESQLEQAGAGLEQARSALRQTEDTTEANIESAQAGLRAAEESYADLARGARSQEREQAQEQVRLAELQVENTRLELQRMISLKDSGAASQQTVDNARLAYDSAVGQLQIAQESLSLTNEGPTQEQLRIAETQIEQARQAVRTAEAARAQVDQQRQAVRTAEESVRSAEIGLRDARNRELTVQTAAADVEAAEEAVAQARALYDQALDSSGPTIGVDEKEIEAAKAGLRSAQATLAIYQAQRAKRIVTTPVSGIISQRHVDEGEVAPMGGGPLLTIVTTDMLEFTATVSELDVNRITVGDPVDVTVDGLPGTEILGTVAEILPAGDVASRNFTIKITIPAGQGVKPGMFARGQVAVDAALSTVILPDETLLEESGEWMVYVIEGGIARRQSVTLGLEGVGVVQVTGGVSAGDQVVYRGKESLSDGTRVEVSETSEYDVPQANLLSAAPEENGAAEDPETASEQTDDES